MKFIAKPNVLNFHGARESDTEKEAVEFLNNLTLNDSSGEPQVKMKPSEWMDIGKLMKVG